MAADRNLVNVEFANDDEAEALRWAIVAHMDELWRSEYETYARLMRIRTSNDPDKGRPI